MKLKLVAFVISLLMTINSYSQNQLIYVYDALCGWCYGFSPVIQKLAEEQSDRFSVEVISGGMITGEREGPIGEVAAYIKHAYKDVEKRSGVTFGTKFLHETLAEGKAYFSSIPPAKALSVVKEMKPELSLKYAAGLQRLIYFEGVHPQDLDSYSQLADSLGLDKARFEELINSVLATEWALADFKRSAALQVNGFPSVFLRVDYQLYLVAKGYTDFESISRRIDEVLGKAKKE